MKGRIERLAMELGGFPMRTTMEHGTSPCHITPDRSGPGGHDRGVGASIPGEKVKEKTMIDPIPFKAAEMIHDERYRQQVKEGYTLAHDDKHTEGQMALLAAAYALASRGYSYRESGIYQVIRQGVKALEWDFKPGDPIRDLTRAGALILAELERRLRAEEKEKMPENKSHKVVAADKIVAAIDESPSMHGHWNLLCGASVPVSLQLAHRVPEGVSPVGGYYIRYKNGFESWSPAEAFESGYTRLPECP